MLSCVVGLVVPSFSKDCLACNRVKQTERMTLVGLLDPEDEGTTVLQNIGNLSHSDVASHHRRLKSSTILTAYLVAEN
jgi:hypothetical protein